MKGVAKYDGAIMVHTIEKGSLCHPAVNSSTSLVILIFKVHSKCQFPTTSTNASSWITAPAHPQPNLFFTETSILEDYNSDA